MKIGFGFSKRAHHDDKDKQGPDTGRVRKHTPSDTREIEQHDPLDEAAPRLDDQEDFENDPFVLEALKAPKPLKFDPKELDTRPMSQDDLLSVLREYERMLGKK